MSFLNYIYHQKMNNNQEKDLVSAGLTAAIGAGIITSYAVSQGQNPLVATGITVFSALLAVIIHQADLI